VTDRKRIQIYVREEEYQQVKEWSNESGKSISELGREAILEYTDHDRLRRIEEKLDQVVEAGSQSGDAHTHTGSSTSSVPEKARSVAQHLYDQYEMPVKTTDVELGIENIADVGDDRSVSKYKEQLKKRGLLFEHPSGNVWTDSKEQFVNWIEGAYVDPDIHEITGEYDLETEEYIEIANEQ